MHSEDVQEREKVCARREKSVESERDEDGHAEEMRRACAVSVPQSGYVELLREAEVIDIYNIIT